MEYCNKSDDPDIESETDAFKYFVVNHQNLEATGVAGFAFYNIHEKMSEESNIGGGQTDAADTLEAAGYEVVLESIEASHTENDLVVKLSVSKLSD